MPITNPPIELTLQQYFGVRGFRPGQWIGRDPNTEPEMRSLDAKSILRIGAQAIGKV